MRGVDVALVVSVVLLVIVLGLWGYSAFFSTSGVLFAPTESRVTIDRLTDIEFSPELAAGIDFGDVDPDPSTVDVDALENDQGVGGATLYAVIKGPEATIDPEICISASADLENGPFSIPVEGPTNGETYDYNSDDALPGLPGTFFVIDPPGPPVLASDVLTDAVPAVYYRFWLDVVNPAQEAGQYTNDINFIAQDPTCTPGVTCVCAT